MKQSTTLQKQITWLRISIGGLTLVLCSMLLFSFTVQQLSNNFLEQLGITQATANDKITGSLLGGSFDTWGIKNTRSIPSELRVTVAKEALSYARQHTLSASFVKSYTELRESKKPVPQKIQTPEELQKETIEQLKEGVRNFEKIVKQADASLKPAFEKSLAEAKKQQEDALNPNHKTYVAYRKNYEGMVKTSRENHQRLLAEWEQEFPSNQQLFVKKRLEQFLQETNDIDFQAVTVTKGSKMVFADAQYERKSARWKMAYRAGKDVVNKARTFIENWIKDIQ